MFSFTKGVIYEKGQGGVLQICSRTQVDNIIASLVCHLVELTPSRGKMAYTIRGWLKPFTREDDSAISPGTEAFHTLNSFRQTINGGI